MTKPRVVVGISGGVDSSVSALLLLQQGYDVHGVFMKNWEDSYEPGFCGAAQDLEDAADSCDTLGIPLHKVNFSTEYRDRVFRHFLNEYRRGRTPNPDVLCNKEIKFKAFLGYAERLGADRIATGHYARTQLTNGRWSLLKGADVSKDQSYFLHSLDQSQLGKALFPVGTLQKSQVRELAREADLVTHDKKDSTGICFIGERDFRAFLGRYLPARPGEMRSVDGRLIGEHAGLSFYTLGQRQGLGIGGQRGGCGGAWYVVDKDLENNVLVVAEGSRHPRLYHHRLLASQLEWVAGRPPPSPQRCRAKIRYRQADQACTLELLSGQRCTVAFEAAQRAITPGQSIVFYAGEECLGGGIIDAAFD